MENSLYSIHFILWSFLKILNFFANIQLNQNFTDFSFRKEQSEKYTATELFETY